MQFNIPHNRVAPAPIKVVVSPVTIAVQEFHEEIKQEYEEAVTAFYDETLWEQTTEILDSSRSVLSRIDELLAGYSDDDDDEDLPALEWVDIPPIPQLTRPLDEDINDY